MAVYLRYCPDCGEEYQPHMTRCIECGGTLQEKLDDGEWPQQKRRAEDEAGPQLPPGEYRKLVLVAPATAGALMPRFQEAGIPVKMDLHPRGMLLRARDEDLATAMSIVEEEGVLPRQPDLAAPAVAVDGGPCPACATPVRPGASECPECGLVLTGAAECPSCGEPVAPTDDVCPACGQPQG